MEISNTITIPHRNVGFLFELLTDDQGFADTKSAYRFIYWRAGAVECRIDARQNCWASYYQCKNPMLRKVVSAGTLLP